MARVDVVGLGPAGVDLMTRGTWTVLERADTVVLRTRRHPAADALPDARALDHHYEQGATFEDVYRAIVEELVAEALTPRGDRPTTVAYAVPGSPAVAEHTVVLLRSHPAVTAGDVEVVVHPAMSFVDLALSRVAVDPMTAGLSVVDGTEFAVQAAGRSGPLLVAQCWSRQVLSDVKLSVDPPPEGQVTLLHHLGLDDEVVVEVPWSDLDRTLEPDHLTSLWVPAVGIPVAAELVALEELVRTLRSECPWDRVQTHGSLARHLLEESYEALEAVDALAALDEATPVAGDTGHPGAVSDEELDRAVAHLAEELGDLLFQVVFHAALAAEAGRFSLADVAAGVREKLVFRHPHVFGGTRAATADEVAAGWEVSKLAEKGRTRITDGIPAALPALALAAKLQRKALAVGLAGPTTAARTAEVVDQVDTLGRLVTRSAAEAGPGRAAADTGNSDAGNSDAGASDTGTSDTGTDAGTSDRAAADGGGGVASDLDTVGVALFGLVDLAHRLGVDPETALRRTAGRFRDEIDAVALGG